uniref:Uncharacterized protein n=1 Tax=Ditylenchus dipsaci TaxID=166011 RepID=A0A915DIZ2_9BILA
MSKVRGSPQIYGSSTSENTTMISTEELHKLRMQNSDFLKKSKDAEEFIEEKENEINVLEKQLKNLLEETTSKIAALNSQVNSLTSDLNSEKSSSEILSRKLQTCEEELKAERDKSLGGPLNETALFNAETKVEQVQAQMIAMKEECSELVNHNHELLENIHKLESTLEEKNSEIESLRNQNSQLRMDLNASKEEVMVLTGEMHAIKADPKMASQGNSLFGEVIDGREKQEKEMLLLHQEKQKLKIALDNTLKLLHEQTKQENIPFDKNALTGPTLAAFKIARDELTRCQREKTY